MLGAWGECWGTGEILCVQGRYWGSEEYSVVQGEILGVQGKCWGHCWALPHSLSTEGIQLCTDAEEALRQRTGHLESATAVGSVGSTGTPAL